MKLLERQIDELTSKLITVTEQKVEAEVKSQDALLEVEKFSDENLQLKRALDILKMTTQHDRDLLMLQIKESEEDKRVLIEWLDGYKGRDEQMELRLVMVMVELDRQIQLNQQKDMQITSLQQRITALEHQLEEDISIVRKQNKELFESALAKQKADHEVDIQELKEHSLKILEMEKAGVQRVLRAEFEEQLTKVATAHQLESADLKSKIESLIVKIRENDLEFAQQENESQRLSSEFIAQTKRNEEQQRENESLRDKIEAIASELASDRVSFERNLEKDQLRIKELMNSNQELQKDILSFTKETERLNRQIKEYQQKLATADAQNRELLELREQFETLKKSSLMMKDLSVRFEAEKVAYEAKIFKLEAKINELEMQNSNLSHELKGFRELVDKNNTKVDQTQKQLMNKILDLDKLRNRYEECLIGINSSPRTSNIY